MVPPPTAKPSNRGNIADFAGDSCRHWGPRRVSSMLPVTSASAAAVWSFTDWFCPPLENASMNEIDFAKALERELQGRGIEVDRGELLEFVEDVWKQVG